MRARQVSHNPQAVRFVRLAFTAHKRKIPTSDRQSNFRRRNNHCCKIPTFQTLQQFTELHVKMPCASCKTSQDPQAFRRVWPPGLFCAILGVLASRRKLASLRLANKFRSKRPNRSKRRAAPLRSADLLPPPRRGGLAVLELIAVFLTHVVLTHSSVAAATEVAAARTTSSPLPAISRQQSIQTRFAPPYCLVHS